MLRCVQSARKKSCDYRDSSEGTNWGDVVKDVSMTANDIRTIWFFINKEVCSVDNNVCIGQVISCQLQSVCSGWSKVYVT